MTQEYLPSNHGSPQSLYSTAAERQRLEQIQALIACVYERYQARELRQALLTIARMLANHR